MDRSERGPGEADPTRTAQEAAGKLSEESRRVAEQARQKGEELAEEQRGALAETIEKFAHALRRTADNLRAEDQPQIARYTGDAAGALETFSRRVRDQDVRGLIHQVEDYAREQPAVFIGASVAAGFLLSRFLKSSSPGGEQEWRGARTEPASGQTGTTSPWPSQPAGAREPGISPRTDGPI